MPLFLPGEAYLVHFDFGRDEDAREEFMEEMEEEYESWNLNLFEDEPMVALSLDAPMAKIRKRRGYARDQKVWVFTNVDMHGRGWFFRDFPHKSIRTVSCCMGTSVIAGVKDDGLAALSECYLPVRLLWHVWNRESGDLKRLARAALDGDEKAYPVLADALTDAGHPLAGPARFICADALGLGKAEGVLAFSQKEYPRTLGLTPDGKAAFVHEDDGTVFIRAFSDGKIIRGTKHVVPELRRDDTGSPATVFSACGRYLAMLRGRTLACWRVRPWELLWKAERAEDEQAHSIQMSTHGALVGAHCRDEVLRVWDAESGEEVGELPRPKKTRLLNLTDAGWAFRHEDGRFGLWAPGGKAKVAWRDMPEDVPAHLSNALVSPDGTRMAGRDTGGLLLMDILGKKVIARPATDGYQDPFAWTPMGSRFFTGYHGTILAWDGHRGAPMGSFEVKKGFSQRAVSAVGDTVAGWASGDPFVRAWRVDGSAGPEPVKLHLETNILSVAVSADGKRVAAVGPRASHLTEYTPEGGGLGNIEYREPTAVGYAEGGLLLAGRRDGRLTLRKGTKSRWSDELGSEVVSVAASPGAGLFAAGVASGTVALFDAAGRMQWRTRVHEGRVTGLGFDGPGHVISCGADGKVLRYEADSGEAEEEYAGEAPLCALGVRPGGEMTAAVEAGKCVLLIGPAAGGVDEITSLCPFSVCFASDDVLVIGCWGEVVFLRLSTREVLRRVPAGEGDVTAVSYSNGVLAAGGWDRHLRMWKIKGE